MLAAIAGKTELFLTNAPTPRRIPQSIVQIERITDQHASKDTPRTGLLGLIERCRDAYPLITKLFADSGYAGQRLKTALGHLDRVSIEIVERNTAWLNLCRRLANDWEASSEAWLIIASIRRMTRRIANIKL